jgi:membrane protease YdiL (CAAX protease family)
LLEAASAGPTRRPLLTLGAFVAALGAVALSLRPVSAPAMLIAVMVGSSALLVPLPADDSPRVQWGAAISLLVGTIAFVLAAWLGPPLAGPLGDLRWGPATAPGAAAAVAVAVLEEAFFRRLVYGLMLPLGVVAAVGGSAFLFALVHLPLYGWATLPLDLAAGLVLGWQRRASGGWAIPAVTHGAANLLSLV